VNLLKQGRDAFDFDQTRVRIELGDFKPRSQGVTVVHSEIDLNGCTNVVDIVTGGKIAIPGHPEECGVVISIDTLRSSAGLIASAELPQVLEMMHETEKEVFFGLLSVSTIQNLGPRYPATN
jgi:uncharacterized protein (TIGR04255 family)